MYGMLDISTFLLFTTSATSLSLFRIRLASAKQQKGEYIKGLSLTGYVKVGDRRICVRFEKIDEI